ncbi:hypothetical protein ILUMI_05386 [Ignelater luminosus]|uniref:Uncharacterized protein n=1 Tax=Ignelater luminosus TaxID=2038154 RepID=A0A8K0DCD8_IGNLU|nr:hypothetical protein ILUMI_05386 [Ignelater luminosus]
MKLQNTVDKLVQRANASLLIGTSSWKEQFVEALTVSSSSDEEEKVPSCCDYFLHSVTLFWKILFAFVPPTDELLKRHESEKKSINCVIPLGAINCKIKIYDTVTPIDTNLLYQRILSTFKQDDELEEYFKFELSSIPQLLFDELAEKMKENSMTILQALDNADSLIVNTAISYTTTNPLVIIVGKDVDVMVLMVTLTPEDKDIYMLKPGKGKNKNVIYSSAAEQKRHSSIETHLLFLHAASRCNITSGFMNKGKRPFSNY